MFDRVESSCCATVRGAVCTYVCWIEYLQLKSENPFNWTEIDTRTSSRTAHGHCTYLKSKLIECNLFHVHIFIACAYVRCMQLVCAWHEHPSFRWNELNCHFKIGSQHNLQYNSKSKTIMRRAKRQKRAKIHLKMRTETGLMMNRDKSAGKSSCATWCTLDIVAECVLLYTHTCN